jgi:ComEC/Rec2-related protein
LTSLALLGWLNLAVRTSVMPADDLRRLLGPEPASVALRGSLIETPKLKISQRDDQEKWRSVARVQVRELRRNDSWQPAAGEVLVTTPDILGPTFFSGQPIEVAGVVAPPPPPLAEGLFDYRQYLADRGIYFQLKTESTNAWKLLEPHRSVPPLTDRFLNWSRQTLALGLPVEDEPLRLLWAMTLGWRAAFTGDVAEPFLQAGTQHMFAIDGLRIALVSGMIVALLGLLRLSRAWCGCVAVPALWFYTAATGWDASAVRASVMMTVVLGGWMLKRPGDLLNSLAAAALIILLLDPRQLVQASFLLSFFVMLVIALLLPPLNAGCDRLIDYWLKPDPLLPDELVPGWRKSLLAWARRLAHFCALSLAAWLGCLPLAAKFFHLFSPVSTPANVVAVPLGTLALTANLGALICGHWLPWCTVLFNHAAWFFMSAMTWVSVQAARLPGAYFYVSEPSMLTIALYYAGIVAAFSGWFTSARRRIAGAFILLLIGAAYGWHWQSSRAETDLTVLPLNGGQAVYVDADGRRNDWLINCGSEDAVNFTLKEFLRAHGVNSLPRLVLSDASARNCGGAARLDELFGVGELWTSSATFRSAPYRAALARFEAAATTRHHVLKFGETVGAWQVLFPATTGSVSKADDAALVLRGNFCGTRILLLSDLSRAGQSDVLAQMNDLRADLVIEGLPDEGEPLCAALIAAIQPQAIVIADSEYPATRRASRALHARLEQTRIPVFYTRAVGAVKITGRPTGWSLETTSGQKLSGKANSEIRPSSAALRKVDSSEGGKSDTNPRPQ